jgi:hypothetical protein
MGSEENLSAAYFRARSAGSWGMPDRPQKITFADMRDMGMRGLLSDYRCSQSVAKSADRWPDNMRLSFRATCETAKITTDAGSTLHRADIERMSKV